LSHTYVQNAVHLVFSTKDRQRMIPTDQKQRFWSYIAGICKAEKIFVHAINGMEDHIHLLLEVPSTMSLAEGARVIKSNSSGWMKTKRIAPDFAWQQGYGAFGVSKSNMPAVIRYIRTQAHHHKKMTFEVEFKALLTKHGIVFNPKYVFG
jgi:putative transposase